MFNEKRITFDLFVCGYSKNQIHIPTFFELCHNTGGDGYYYNINDNINFFTDDIKYKFEKLHYDINRVLTRREYSDVQISLKTNSGIDVSDILGNFGRKSNGVINLTSCHEDYNLMYNLKFKKLKEDKKYSFQFVITYTDPYENMSKMRVLNYALYASNDTQLVYNQIDVDCLTKLILMKELSSTVVNTNKNICCFDRMKENIIKRITECLYFYKSNVKYVLINSVQGIHLLGS